MKSIKIEKKEKKERIQGKHAKFDISCFGRCDQILQFHWSLNSESRNGGVNLQMVFKKKHLFECNKLEIQK